MFAANPLPTSKQPFRIANNQQVVRIAALSKLKSISLPVKDEQSGKSEVQKDQQ
jgi:hypothetical protein